MDNLPSDIKIIQYADDITLIAQDTDLERVKVLFTRAVITIRTNLQAMFGISYRKDWTNLVWKFTSDTAHYDCSNRKITIHTRPVIKFVVHIDNLDFKTHTENLVKQRSNIIRFLKGTWWICDPQTLLLIYKIMLIRSKLDWCLWFYPTNKLQRRTTKRSNQTSSRL